MHWNISGELTNMSKDCQASAADTAFYTGCLDLSRHILRRYIKHFMQHICTMRGHEQPWHICRRCVAVVEQSYPFTVRPRCLSALPYDIILRHFTCLTLDRLPFSANLNITFFDAINFV